MSLQFFNSINITVPQKQIYKRLGYYSGITKISKKQKQIIENYKSEALLLLKLQGVALHLPIIKRIEDTVFLSDKISFKSKLLSNLVKNCSEILFMGVTSGKKIVNAIYNYEKKDLLRSAVYDAVASEYTDACFDWIYNYYKQELLRENKTLLSKRISCGFSDFSIQYQKVIFEILQLDKLGITITDTYMLLPEKSATAVTGIIKKDGKD
ncbi:MAG: hypothetical protein NC925_03470 [Candidatus Omnitrophica bacterium]|nr:hypothetical protein [Candidatus Omnitrophota bacterium]MCM8831323.1 hypothetical protein [Candidatus Omnitrophota bacterium]